SAYPTLYDSPTRFAPTWPAPTMPELPEVESLRRILVRTAVGRTIVKVRVGEKRLRRRVTANFGPAVAGRRIVKLSRRAKYLIVELDGDDVMLVHLGMSGSLTHRHKGFGPEPLSREFNADYLAEKARGRTASIKNLIMDQRIVAGIGNIYASEVL